MVSRYEQGKHVSTSLSENLCYLTELASPSMDLVIREFRLGNGQPAAAFFIDGLVDNDMLGRDFFSPLMKAKGPGYYCAADLTQSVLLMGEVKIFDNLDQVTNAVLQGLTALFIEGDDHAVCVQAINWPQRSVEEPGTDVVVRGPREGFVESVRVNVSLLRRKIHHPDLMVEKLQLGRYSRTDVCLVYVSSIVDRDVLEQLRRRLARIDIDAIMDSGQIEQLIQDTPYSVFPTINVAEKPDLAASRILEGRVALLADGSPIVLTVPMLFSEGLFSAEDYYTRFYYATFIRIVRIIGFLISIYLPGFFLAAVCYHQQIVPFRLLLEMSVAEAETPFSVGFSLLLIGLAYEILREAGVRLPRPAGQAISIVGAIVMGDAAVNAGLISAAVLIVLAITVVASFVSSSYPDASTLLRIIFLLISWMFGFFGLLLGSLVLLVYLCSLNSVGVPFFAPFAPLDKQGMKDSAVRAPLWKMKFRPAVLSMNRRRMSANTNPLQGKQENRE